jgi:hypothetical protein
MTPPHRPSDRGDAGRSTADAMAVGNRRMEVEREDASVEEAGDVRP